MAHHIEQAKSGRSACKACRDPIAQGELRLGEEVMMGGRPSTRWYHLTCAAAAKPALLREALGAFEGEIADRARLLAAIDQPPEETGPVDGFPFAERSDVQVACDRCGEAIARDALRVAVMRREDHGTYVRLGAEHLHPECARALGLGKAEATLIRKHSRGVSAGDFALLDSALGV